MIAPTPLICLDPGHGTPPAIGRQVEPIGPGSRTLKIKDGGGAAGEAPVALAIALRARRLLLARGYRVAMTRTGPTIHLGDGDGNIARARFCNRRHAALMARIHADGSTDRSQHGFCPPGTAAGRTTSTHAACLPGARSRRQSCARRARLIAAWCSAAT